MLKIFQGNTQQRSTVMKLQKYSNIIAGCLLVTSKYTHFVLFSGLFRVLV